MRPGIVHSSPAAQSIVRFYCSSGRGVSRGGWYVLVCVLLLGRYALLCESYRLVQE